MKSGEVNRTIPRCRDYPNVIVATWGNWFTQESNSKHLFTTKVLESDAGSVCKSSTILTTGQTGQLFVTSDLIGEFRVENGCPCMVSF